MPAVLQFLTWVVGIWELMLNDLCRFDVFFCMLYL